jgi:hypothetical protein
VPPNQAFNRTRRDVTSTWRPPVAAARLTRKPVHAISLAAGHTKSTKAIGVRAESCFSNFPQLRRGSPSTMVRCIKGSRRFGTNAVPLVSWVWKALLHDRRFHGHAGADA